MQRCYFLQIAGFHLLVRFLNLDTIEQRVMIVDFEVNYYHFFVKKEIKPDFILEIKKSLNKKKFLEVDKVLNKIVLIHKGINQGIERQFVILNSIRIDIAMRTILQELLLNNGFFLHCSANLVNNKVILFLADKGGGKSTISKLLHNTYPSITDDLGIVKYVDRKFFFYQTPFPDKDKIPQKTKKKYIIRAICFISKGGEFSYTQSINKLENVIKLTKQVWVKNYQNTKIMQLILNLVNQNNRFYFLNNNLDKQSLLKFICNYVLEGSRRSNYEATLLNVDCKLY